MMAEVAEATPMRQRVFARYLGFALSTVLLVAVIAVAVVALVVPRVAGATALTVLTSSMEPRLPPGTLIVVRPVDPDTLAIGDVITYQIESGLPAVVTHRIIGIDASSTGARTFALQGDNNSDPDPEPVLEQQIQGELWYAVPMLGWVNTMVSGESRAWIIPLAAVLLLGYAGYMTVTGSIAAVRQRRRRLTSS